MVFPVINETETGTEAPQVFDLSNPNNTAAEKSKILIQKIADNLATRPPDTVEPPIVNPLKLPYFMVATIGKLFCYRQKSLLEVRKSGRL